MTQIDRLCLLDEFDLPVLSNILKFCVEDTSISLVQTCKTFRDLIYFTPNLLNLHLINISDYHSYFLRNENNHRYSYLIWLIQHQKFSIEKYIIKIYDIQQLKKLDSMMPKYLNVNRMTRLATDCLILKKQNVFKYIWSKVGKQIVQIEKNVKSLCNKSTDSWNYWETVGRVSLTLLSLGQFEQVKKLFGLKFYKSLSMNSFVVARERLYSIFFDFFKEKNSSLGSFDVQTDIDQLIEIDTSLQTEFRSLFFLNLGDYSIFWDNVVIQTNWDIITRFNHLKLFKFNYNLKKQHSNQEIMSICLSILENNASNLYDFFKFHIQLLKRTNESDEIYQIFTKSSIYQNKDLFSFVFDKFSEMINGSHAIWYDMFRNGCHPEVFEIIKKRLQPPLLSFGFRRGDLIISFDQFLYFIEKKVKIVNLGSILSDWQSIAYVLNNVDKLSEFGFTDEKDFCFHFDCKANLAIVFSSQKKEIIQLWLKTFVINRGQQKIDSFLDNCLDFYWCNSESFAVLMDVFLENYSLSESLGRFLINLSKSEFRKNVGPILQVFKEHGYAIKTNKKFSSAINLWCIINYNQI